MVAGPYESCVRFVTGELDGEAKRGGGFTLVELLVVVGIVSLLTGILLPALGKVRRQARCLLGASNQRQIVEVANCFAADNEGRYPESVATIGFGEDFSWQEPTTLIGHRKREPRLHRSLSTYLGDYVSDASMFFCPSSPREHTYLQQAWEAGEDWGNPDMPLIKGPMTGTYCFYWNYEGYLGGDRVVFDGPSGPAGGRRESKLMVSCYFGYDHWRSPGVYSSCEKFGGADVTEETWMCAAYWSGREDANDPGLVEIKPRGAYTDGHVESYSSSDVVPMKVIKDRETLTPHDLVGGPGVFYLPQAALY